jgi:hypothetical protein
MNTRLRNSLSALALAASVTSLGYVLGEPLRPGSLVAGIGNEAVSAITMDAADASADAVRSESSLRASARSPHALPFFSFGKRAAVGAP